MLKALTILSVIIASVQASFLVLEERDNPPDGYSRLGSTPSDKFLNFCLALAQNDILGLHEAVYDVSTPGNARYGQYLSKEEVAKFVAPSAKTSWLTSNDLTSSPLTDAGDWIAVKMTVSQANRLLAAEFSTFHNPSTNHTVDRTLSYSIPSGLKAGISTIYPTVTFPGATVRSAINRTVATAAGANRPAASVSPDRRANSSWGPACLQELYEISSTPAKPAANVLAVSGFVNDFANKRDLKSFLLEFRPDIDPNTTFGLISVDGGINNQLPAGSGVQSTADIQYTVGLATGVPVDFISTGPPANDVDIFAAYLTQADYLLSLTDPPQTVLHAFADLESDTSPALAESICNSYAQLAARGVSYIVDTGIWGAGGSPFGECILWDPPFPATCPFVTAVGATEFFPDETDETGTFFSGGGFSNFFERPRYQDTAVPAYLETVGASPSSPFNISGRAVPDVSAISRVPFFQAGQLVDSAETTGFSASIFASIIALLSNERIVAGKKGLGFLNPLIYQNPGAFKDMPTGFNPGAGCSVLGFNGTVGWDPVTGFGSPSYTKLQEACNKF
ncbi:family S53 protease [Mycena albidolilacea]|uniref:Family S53 protease n=1 Tax=Mycena albidolilacea TaxID=1033008 RepID=A0AAD7EHT5_9AGAR|nr:family S53 protease [Mycena albidolilacea]